MGRVIGPTIASSRRGNPRGCRMAFGSSKCIRQSDVCKLRPTKSLALQPTDGFRETFVWDDALWSGNAYSGVLASEDSTIRVAPDVNCFSEVRKTRC